MNDDTLGYLFTGSADTKARLTAHFHDEIAECSVLLDKLVATLLSYTEKNPPQQIPLPKQLAFGLIWKAANSLKAALELALGGYMLEPPALLRNAVENSAVAWDLVHNEDRFRAWSRGKKFESTQSISNLKAVSSFIRPLYGLLSNVFVHARPPIYAPAMFIGPNGPAFQRYGFLPPGKEEIRRTEIYFVLTAIFICLQVTELVFHEYSPGLETIERIPDTGTVRSRIPLRHRRFVDALTAHFKAVSDGTISV